MAPQVTLFVSGRTANPAKVAILLEELEVEYRTITKEFGDGPNGLKGEDYLKINPNGRLPALIDHTNNDHIIWESGAILLYVAERFDPTGRHALAGRTLEEKAEVWQWLMFQISTIGPMQGQLFWFFRYHPVKDLDQSVYHRYKNECYRIY
ncbi:hypothetical protein M422DRAFT_163742 [Sphaerobolus stellatus SS14]|nr:hypothetical protein M422DRAFT_163742 [Sphaerobolus stellatus SS14]